MDTSKGSSIIPKLRAVLDTMNYYTFFFRDNKHKYITDIPGLALIEAIHNLLTLYPHIAQADISIVIVQTNRSLTTNS